MTDKERQKLCADLRQLPMIFIDCKQAADEIERLAAEVKALKAEIEAE